MIPQLAMYLGSDGGYAGHHAPHLVIYAAHAAALRRPPTASAYHFDSHFQMLVTFISEKLLKEGD
jgi:hypothetical protein